MKISFILFVLAFAFHGKAQSLEYSIDQVRPDSIYLVETTTSKPTADQPRPMVQVGYTLFRSYSELSKFIESIKLKATKDEDEAQKQYTQSQQMKQIAAKIEDAAAKSLSHKKE